MRDIKRFLKPHRGIVILVVTIAIVASTFLGIPSGGITIKTEGRLAISSDISLSVGNPIASADPGSWLTGWDYRKEITINGTTEGTQTDYQMMLDVNYNSGSDSGASVNCSGNCQTDFDDIRFTISDGETLLDQWLEEKTDSDDATFWVEFDSITGGSENTTNFYIYYGNAGAGSGSVGADTFIKFDDFERGNDGDEIGGDWTEATGTVEISTEQSHQGTRSMKLVGDNVNKPSVSISVTHSDNIAIRFRGYKEGASRLVFRQGDGTEEAQWMAETNEEIGYNDDIWRWTGQYIVADTWKLYEVRDFDWTGYTYDVIYDGGSVLDNVGAKTSALNDDIVKLLGVQTTGADTWIDNFLVRNYIEPEPTWGAWGSEEECEADISNTPDSKDFGNVTESATPDTGLTHFNVTNNSGGNITITVQATNMTGTGIDWALSDTATPGADIYGLKAGVEGGAFDIIVKLSSPYNNLVAALPDGDSQRWGLKLYVPTSFSNGNPKSGTITLSATCDV